MSQRDALSLRETMAALCHEQWSGWMRHLFSKCKTAIHGGDVVEDIGLLIPQAYVEALQKQMSMAYDELSPSEQDSDRREADRFLALIKDDKE